MQSLNRLLFLVGSIVWHIGKLPAAFSTPAAKHECFKRYGISASAVGFLFLAWELAFAKQPQLQLALTRLAAGKELVVRIGGAGLLVVLIASRVLLATFMLGIILTVLRMFTRKP